MSSDIRVVPFTDEEKARLNEKVQKMRFSRPPPKLPTQLKRLFLKTAPSQAISLPQTSAQVGRSLNEKGNVIEDSGISSCGSEKDSSPGFRRSPVDLIAQDYQLSYSKYICDGEDWVPDGSDHDASSIQLDEINNHSSLSSVIVLDGEEKEGDSLIDSVENNEDFNHLDSSHVLIAACNSVTVNNSSNHPVEIINARSPVVYSQQLLSTLSRNRGDLLGIALRAEEKIGKFENPTYGRLLLTKNFPVESMKFIMNSALKNLTAYFNNRKPKPVRAVLKSKSVESPSLSDTSVRNENSSRMEDMERVEPEVNGIKLVRSRKRKGGNKANNETIVNSNSMKSSAQINFKHQQAVRNMKKKRKRNLSIVSTTSDGPKKSFKIVIRRDAPTEVANPLLARIIAATNGSENGSVHNGQCSSSFILKDRMGDRRPQHSETNTIAGTSTLVTGNQAFKEESVDEDVVIVHENIRVTPEERSLVAQLAALIEVESVNTEQCNWFDELLGKARQFARHIDHHIEILMNSKLEMARVRLKQMAEHTRCQSLLQERRSAMACRDDLSNVPDAVAPELLSQCSQISPDVSYLSLKDELRGVRGRKRCLRRAGNVQAVGPGDGRHCTPIVSNVSQQAAESTSRRCAPARLALKRRLTSSPYNTSACSTLRRNSLNVIIDRLKSLPEDIPRDPMPSSPAAAVSQEVAPTSSDFSANSKAPLLFEPRKSHSPFPCTTHSQLRRSVNSPHSVTTAVPFKIPVSLTTGRRPHNVHWIAKRTSEISRPRYTLKKGLCCERKYGIAATGRHVESLVQRRDPISLKDTGEIKEVS